MAAAHERLRKLRIEAGFKNARDAADAMGIPAPTYYHHEGGKRAISPTAAQHYADFFKVETAWLLFGEPTRVPLGREWESAPASDAHNAYSRESYRPKIAGAIPEIDVEAGAGEGRVGEVIALPIGSETYSGHRVIDEWLLPETYLSRVIEASAGNTLVIAVVGDSMVPTYSPGDRVFVDLSQNQLATDTVYVISDGFSPPQIKRLQRVLFTNPPEVRIISDNSNHESQTVPLQALTIIGRVTGVTSKR